MQNDVARAEFWRQTISGWDWFAGIERLRANLEGATFFEFCDCGCNSFSVEVSGNPPLLTPPSSGGGHFFWACFRLGDEPQQDDERYLEISLSVNAQGHLDYVEVICCANSYPVPDVRAPLGEPFKTQWT